MAERPSLFVPHPLPLFDPPTTTPSTQPNPSHTPLPTSPTYLKMSFAPGDLAKGAGLFKVSRLLSSSHPIRLILSLFTRSPLQPLLLPQGRPSSLLFLLRFPFLRPDALSATLLRLEELTRFVACFDPSRNEGEKRKEEREERCMLTSNLVARHPFFSYRSSATYRSDLTSTECCTSYSPLPPFSAGLTIREEDREPNELES